ncbi:hypothetical protein [Rubrivirga sp.]|uniref:hypothetical protein n=1 Tax=Rubrivirga sp. TaxID=1885344 RepID=UPI003B516E7D
MTDPSPEAEAGVDGLPAFERVQTRSTPPPPDARRAWRPATGALLVLLVVAGVAGTAWWLWPSPGEADDVLVHLVETSDTFLPDLTTTDPNAARSLVLDALGWDVAPPDLPSLTVVGVGIPSIGEVQPSPGTSPSDVQVPAFRYEGADGERATVFAYDYILLDRVGAAFDLPDGTYAALSEPTPVDSRVVEGRFVVSWRRRAMIFSAVTSNEAVAERIRQTVSS